MVWLLRLTAASLLLCAIAIGAVKVFGTARTDPLAGWFTNVDGSRCTMPCLFGIQPGVTGFDEAVKIIAQHPASRSMQPKRGNASVAFTFGNDHVCVTLWRSRDDRLDGMMLFSTPDCFSTPLAAPQAVELGQLITVLGPPDSVSLDAYGVAQDDYFFLGGTAYFQALNIDDSCIVSPTINYELLVLGTQDSRVPPLPEWKGFARRTTYALTPDERTSLSKCSH